MTNQVQIFPVTYFKALIEDNETVKNILVPKIMEDSKDLEIPEGWLTNKLMTSFMGEKPGKEIFFGQDRTYQSLLETRYANCLDSFFGDATYQIAIDEIWYNCYVDGEFQESHDHLSPQIGNNITAHFSWNLNSIEYEQIHYPDINEGDFIMFPSYLTHSVEPSPPTPDYPRITIAMNVRVMEYGNL
jgi:hypothetical protein